ncbi:3-keto-disaccharide hydrolase [Spirosoma fluviale]|uniref:3-keto-alpha-glucoside-1,2-lyase/3-keto-2-hydroxy-glucal hydratase domain-containing protein n=1 Tax=Spirosoma fluviale TaxID=1597977 RepID=A0A286GDM6_9BACT|nr:DUF1080 domain-containing protein [Spirosoma fluviale]SOD93611.1 protein of unknown function [Spirosoma fluviale]
MNYLRFSANVPALRPSVTIGFLALTLTLNVNSVNAAPVPAPTTSAAVQPKHVLKKGKWANLFDGKTLSGWHVYLKEGQPVSDKWTIDDGAIHLASGGAGDLVTDKEYGNFELEVEWKIAEGGNSGIIFHVHEDPKFKSTYQTGPEMQVLDNERHPDAKQGRDGNRTAGSLYDLQKPVTPGAAKPAGEWNKARLVINNGKAEQYLNGKKTAEYPTSGPEWDKMVAESKFKGWEGFGKYATGHIALQDHGNKVWFRNIRIREL